MSLKLVWLYSPCASFRSCYVYPYSYFMSPAIFFFSLHLFALRSLTFRQNLQRKAHRCPVGAAGPSNPPVPYSCSAVVGCVRCNSPSVMRVQNRGQSSEISLWSGGGLHLLAAQDLIYHHLLSSDKSKKCAGLEEAGTFPQGPAFFFFLTL